MKKLILILFAIPAFIAGNLQAQSNAPFRFTDGVALSEKITPYSLTIGTIDGKVYIADMNSKNEIVVSAYNKADMSVSASAVLNKKYTGAESMLPASILDAHVINQQPYIFTFSNTKGGTGIYCHAINKATAAAAEPKLLATLPDIDEARLHNMCATELNSKGLSLIKFVKNYPVYNAQVLKAPDGESFYLFFITSEGANYQFRVMAFDKQMQKLWEHKKSVGQVELGHVHYVTATNKGVGFTYKTYKKMAFVTETTNAKELNYVYNLYTVTEKGFVTTPVDLDNRLVYDMRVAPAGDKSSVLFYGACSTKDETTGFFSKGEYLRQSSMNGVYIGQSATNTAHYCRFEDAALDNYLDIFLEKGQKYVDPKTYRNSPADRLTTDRAIVRDDGNIITTGQNECLWVNCTTPDGKVLWTKKILNNLNYTIGTADRKMGYTKISFGDTMNTAKILVGNDLYIVFTPDKRAENLKFDQKESYYKPWVHKNKNELMLSVLKIAADGDITHHKVAPANTGAQYYFVSDNNVVNNTQLVIPVVDIQDNRVIKYCLLDFSK